MSLSEKSRSAAYHGLTSIIDNEEAVEEMLSYFPARDVEEPVTQEFLRAELGEVRLEIAAFRAEMVTRSEFHAAFEAFRSELGEFKAEMRAEFGEFRSEMRAEFGEFTSEMRGEFGELRTEMRGEFGEFKSGMGAELGGIRSELGELRSKVDTDVQGLRSEVHTEFRDVRSQLDAVHRDVTQSQADMRRLTQWMIGLVISVATLVVAVLAVAVV